MANAASGPRKAPSPYRAVLASRMRSQVSYRASFVTDLSSSLLVGLIELAEVWVLFHNVPVIGGVEFVQILLVFGLADFCFSVADLAFGHCDNLPVYVRAGKLDVFYLRPQPLLAQLITSDISLRRVARGLVGLTALTIGLALNPIDWSLGATLLLIMAVLSGLTVFSAQFVTAAGLQFFLINGSEMTNAFVYGGRYAATQPAAVWSRPLKVAFGFVFPMAFVAYLPVIRLLGLPGPEWLPSWLGWCTPVAALWACGLAAFTWRLGVRHYQGGGG